MTKHVKVPRANLERFGRLLQEFERRKAKLAQSKRGWYDKNGVRQGGLIAFVRYYWHVLEPETPLVDGWPLWAMCEHLEAVTFGELTRLLINVPPGFMKSLLVDVFWPAWEWGPMGMTSLRYVSFSYSASLTERDNGRFRDLVTSVEYQQLYGLRKIDDKSNETSGVRLRNKTTLKVMNTKTGWKLASSVGGVGTGERGDRIVIDDPHNVKESESETVREETVRWFREAISNRFNSLDSGALIIIMQRVHEDDVSGVILNADSGFYYCHLMIPWTFNSALLFDDDGKVSANDIGWIDPRFDPDDPEANDGEPAWPERFSDTAMARTFAEVGPYATAGQYEQSPAPRGGGIILREYWQLWEAPDGKFPPLDYVWASLDGAYTEKEENDPSGFTVWGTFLHPVIKKQRIILLHAWRKHLKFSGKRIDREPNETTERYRRRTMPEWGLVEWVADTCRRFKVDKLMIEAKASGISAAHELQNRYPNELWSTQLCPVVGDKYARMLAVQPTFSQEMIYAPAREWADLVIDELAVFPKGRFKDLSDSTSQAIKHARDIGIARTDAEVIEAELEGVRHKPKPKALYPV